MVNFKTNLGFKAKYIPGKGQIKPKADWPAIDSPKKRTNEFVLVCKYMKLEIRFEQLLREGLKARQNNLKIS